VPKFTPPIPKRPPHLQPSQDADDDDSYDDYTPNNDSANGSEAGDELKAGRRAPTRPAALTKTTRTTNLPHQRTQSSDSVPKRPPPAVPKKLSSTSPAATEISEPTLTPEDFDWSAKRSASMSTLTPTVASAEIDNTSQATKSAHRAFALNPSTSFTARKQSVAEFPSSLPASTSTANHRDSSAIVVKLGITPPVTETPEMMKMRGNLADEILKTEATYLEDLRLIVAKFLVPLRSNMKVISATDAGKLFLNIESLELISEEIHTSLKLAFLQSSSSSQVSLGPVYLQFTETMLQGFSLYCAGHSESLSLLTRLKKKQTGFSTYLEQLECDEGLGKLKLADFLTRPIQHICRQPLLLRELLKSTPQSHPDYEDLIFALDRINDLVDRVNSNAKEVGNIQAITNVESSVNELPEGLKLLMPGRYMLREGRFLRISKDSGKLPVEHYLYLFSDMLILAKPKQFSDTEYVFTELLPLHNMLIEDLADSDTFKNAFSVTSLLSLRSHIFVAKDERKNNEIIKKDWLTAISTTKSRFEKGLNGELADDSLGIGFKVQQGSDTEYINPYEAMRDQLSSVSVQQRIVGWKGNDVLREIWNLDSSTHSPGATFTLPLIVKFHMEAPAALKIVTTDDAEVIENECAVFIFDEFLVLALEKKDVQVKKPYDWLEHVIYSSCVLANSEGSLQEKKIQQGRTVFALSLISASTRKKFVLYFRSDTVKNNTYQILSTKMPSFLDNGAANGFSTSVSASHKRDKSSSKEDDDKSSTLRTKKSFFGRKLGYRPTSQSTSSPNAPTIDVLSSGGGGGGGGGGGATQQTSLSVSDPPGSSKRNHSASAAIPPHHQGTPTPFLASSSSAGNLSINGGSSAHSGTINSSSTTITTTNTTTTSSSSTDDVDDEPEEKLMTAEGFEVPPWFPDDSSNVCLGCNAKFTTTNRRHHCRNCGQLFCKKCTQKKCFLPRFGFTQKKMRVCEKCFLKH
jgi:hypothetical protein